ncbi:serine/threonine-protein kinase NIM1 isoform X2 [Eurytemora carolleeae]|uniref:serine/threonine-protein kinase NIM1 isoform X2 n=1 Tax=Eurytemora carolleeae TaxID=1294199 RepID=UPI000C75C462|nr:serine/threonine-protein kinase NIM1 isoform X2 [Eurytemora carolleeae]|eukprot:XP_023322705.1 serine/threonine-protein kinase NIM1-like isoform X2 [Eurytemora affinis]
MINTPSLVDLDIHSRVNTAKDIAKPVDKENHENPGEPSEPTETAYNKLINKIDNDEDWFRETLTGRRIGFYRFKGELGIGNFSRVRLAKHELTQERVAIKVIDRSNLDQKTTKMLLREISVMSSCNHPSLVKLFEVLEKKDKIYLCMQLAPGGELFTRLTHYGKYSEEKAKPIFSQVSSGICYMHDHGMIHRDVKAENVFFLTPAKVVVGDFGFAAKLGNMEQHLTTFCGSPPYAAPELFQDDHYIGPHVDMWALGILLYFLVTGNMPFKSATVSGLKHAILEGSYFHPPNLSDSCKSLIDSLLQRNPSSRCKMPELASSAWLQDTPWISDDTVFIPYPRIGAENQSDLEKNVLKELNSLGITQKEFSLEMGLGIRSRAIGSYRMLMNKYLNAPPPELRPVPAVSKDPERIPSSSAQPKSSSERTLSIATWRNVKLEPSSTKRSRFCDIL